MIYLKADTNQEVLIGPAVAVGDGFTPVTNLHGGSSNLAGADEAEIIKYGGGTPLTVTDISTNAMTPITGADGYYTLDLSTGNLDTEGFLSIIINDDSLILPIRHDFMVVNANEYDSKYAAAGTDFLQVDVVEQVGTTVPAPNTNGIPDVNVREWLDVAVTLSTGNKPDVNVDEWGDILLATTNTLVDWNEGQRLDLILDIIAVDTTTDIPALIATAQADLNTITDSDGVFLGATAVNLIWDEAMVETTGAPAITGSMRLFMSWWAALSRNDILQTATTTTLRNAAKDGVLSTSPVSDGSGTFTRGEFST